MSAIVTWITPDTDLQSDLDEIIEIGEFFMPEAANFWSGSQGP